MRKYVAAHAKRGRRYLTRRKARHERQVSAALEALETMLGDEAIISHIRLEHDVTAIRVSTEKFGELRTVSSSYLFRILRDHPDLTGVGWFGRLHGCFVVIHTDHGKQEWGKP